MGKISEKNHRGLCKNGDFVFGKLVIHNGIYYIRDGFDQYEVDKNIIDEAIETDMYGQEVFENDIVDSYYYFQSEDLNMDLIDMVFEGKKEVISGLDIFGYENVENWYTKGRIIGIVEKYKDKCLVRGQGEFHYPYAYYHPFSQWENPEGIGCRKGYIMRKLGNSRVNTIDDFPIEPYEVINLIEPTERKILELEVVFI